MASATQEQQQQGSSRDATTGKGQETRTNQKSLSSRSTLDLRNSFPLDNLSTSS